MRGLVKTSLAKSEKSDNQNPPGAAPLSTVEPDLRILLTIPSLWICGDVVEPVREHLRATPYTPYLTEYTTCRYLGVFFGSSSWPWNLLP